MSTDKKLTSVRRREEVGGVQQEITDPGLKRQTAGSIEEVLHVLARDTFWNGFCSSSDCNFLDSKDRRKEEDIRMVEG